MADIVLRVDGMRHRGWKEAHVTRSIDAVSGQFRLTATDRWPGQDERRPIRPGQSCAVEVDGETLITGYIDAVSGSLGSDSRGLSFAGRDSTCDLVDCSAVHRPGEWFDLAADQLVRIFCEPFGVPVALDTGLPVGEAFLRFGLNTGEAAWEAIDRVCRARGILPVSDGLGGIRLMRPSSERAGTEMVEGQNILEIRVDHSLIGRFSEYIVLGQAFGIDDFFGDDAAAIEGRARDAGVPRDRPLVVMAEGLDASEQLQERAEWEAAVRVARGTTVTVKVQGWRQRPGGPLWQPNRITRVRAPAHDLDADMMISACEYRVEESSGTTTTMILRRPDAYLPQPTVQEAGDYWGVFGDD